MSVQLSRATDVDAMQSLVDQLASILEMAGSFRRVCSADDRDQVIRDTCNWYCFGRCRPAFDRFDMQLCRSVGCKCGMVMICYIFRHRCGGARICVYFVVKVLNCVAPGRGCKVL